MGDKNNQNTKTDVLLEIRFPELAKMWDFDKNDVSLNEISFNSMGRYHWTCDKGHTSNKTIIEMLFDGCEVCESLHESFAMIYPELAKEWHPTLNNEITPFDFTVDDTNQLANKYQAFWSCCENPEHAIKQTARNRIENPSKCNFCKKERLNTALSSGLNLTEIIKLDDDLELIYPSEMLLGGEVNYFNSQTPLFWNPIKNEVSKPLFFSDKENYHFICGNGHEYYTNYKQVRIGCSKCFRNAHLLKNTNPDLYATLHPTKNKEINLDDVSLSTHFKMWWKCENNENHVWQETISVRMRIQKISKGICPYCSFTYVGNGNTIADMYPQLIKEWHPTKNGRNTPQNTTEKSKKKIRWINEHGFEWAQNIGSRVLDLGRSK